MVHRHRLQRRRGHPGKPAPDLFELALDRLGLAPAECVVLEDSPHGIRGARAARIPAIGFVGGAHLAGKQEAHAALLRDSGAVAVFDNLADVERFVLSGGPAGNKEPGQ